MLLILLVLILLYCSLDRLSDALIQVLPNPGYLNFRSQAFGLFLPVRAASETAMTNHQGWNNPNRICTGQTPLTKYSPC